MTENNEIKAYVLNEETDQVSRALLVWLNEYPDKPVQINFEYLSDDAVSMSLSTIQGAYKTRQYIDGTYEAEYQFKIIYRGSGMNNNSRLAADELLNAIGDWAAENTSKPQVGSNKRVRSITCNTRASLFARYEDGYEDHQILMTMNYEVI